MIIRDKTIIKGKVVSTVIGPDGNVKRWSAETRLIQWKSNIANMLKFSNIHYIVRSIVLTIFMPFNLIFDTLFPRAMMGVTHNIVTDQGDALIADIMSQTPARQKLDNTHAYIEAGTAYSGTGAKAQTGCHTPTGSRQGMEATYPKQKGAFGAANDNVTQYRSIFAAGAFGSVTVNEAALLNASTSGDCLAYASVTPDAVMTAADSLQIDWEITYLGA